MIHRKRFDTKRPATGAGLDGSGTLLLDDSLCASCTELLDSSSSVHHLLGSGIKCVAIRADFHLDLVHSGTHNELSPTGTGGLGSKVVLWVDFLLHSTATVAEEQKNCKQSMSDTYESRSWYTILTGYT